MGCSGARPGGGRDDPGAAQRRPDPGRARARLARRQRRPGAAGPLRAGADRRGRGRRCPDGAPAPGGDRRWPTPGSSRVALTAKEGLALINGTDGMLGMLVLAIADLERLLRVADVTAAMSVEALLGTDRAFAADLIALRPQPGQAASAANLRALLAGSAIVASHRYGDPRVQDAYSLRCAPQVAGAARDTLAHAERVAAAELRSAIDNPMVLPDGRVESCGNFHGAPVAFACDFLAIAAAEVGAIAERRTDRLLDPTRSHGLPPFLAEDPGVNSGLMIAQYTQAAMVAENRRLAAPASVDSLPTSAMQEDHVSMGWGAARKLRAAVGNLTRILAVELTCAARGARSARPAAARARHRGGAPSRPRADPRAGPRPLPGARAGGGRGAGGVGQAARRASRRRSGRCSEPTATVRAPRGTRALLPRLAAGGGAADADEQPRPRGGRAPRRARRLRRHREGGALVGGVRRDRAHAADAGRRRDAARAVGQAGRRVPHPRVGAARADRQLQPRARVGDLGGVPPARGARADDVRADDRRLVDLHRQPGDRAGHLRVLRRDRPPPPRRLAGRDDHADRRPRRAWAARSRWR